MYKKPAFEHRKNQKRLSKNFQASGCFGLNYSLFLLEDLSAEHQRQSRTMHSYSGRHLPPTLSKRVTWLSRAAPSGQKIGTNSLPSSSPETATPMLTCKIVLNQVRIELEVTQPMLFTSHLSIEANDVHRDILAASSLERREWPVCSFHPQAEAEGARQKV